jgi:hypothetical protein
VSFTLPNQSWEPFMVSQKRTIELDNLVLYFLGSTYIYAAVAAYANIVAERALASAKDIVHMEKVEDLNHDGFISPFEWGVFFVNRFFSVLNWNENKFVIWSLHLKFSCNS